MIRAYACSVAKKKERPTPFDTHNTHGPPTTRTTGLFCCHFCTAHGNLLPITTPGLSRDAHRKMHKLTVSTKNNTEYEYSYIYIFCIFTPVSFGAHTSIQFGERPHTRTTRTPTYILRIYITGSDTTNNNKKCQAQIVGPEHPRVPQFTINNYAPA